MRSELCGQLKRRRCAISGMAACALFVVLLGLPGCAVWNRIKPSTPDVKPLRENRAKSAVAEFERERNLAQYQAALSSWKQGDVKGCRDRLEKLLVREPGRRDASLLMAEVHLLDDEFELAQAIVQKLIDLDANDAQAQHTLGLLFEAQGRQRDAVACYERAVQLAPEDMVIATSYEAAVESLESDGAATAGKSLRASNLADLQGNALASDSDDSASAAPADANNPSDGKRNAVSTGLNATNLTNECRECLRQAEEALDANDGDMFVNCARAAMQAQPHDPKIPNLAAVAALRRNQPALAAQMATEGIHTIGESPDLFRTLGASQYRLGQFAEAQVSLGQSLSLDKSNALAYFLMGCTLNKLGEHEQAEEHLQRARQIDPRYRAGETRP